ncbi:MAG: hypothetical protein FWF61_03255 [Brevinematales bacterium]|nr:hypothetical protein [Brevinematales bacterium]
MKNTKTILAMAIAAVALVLAACPPPEDPPPPVKAGLYAKAPPITADDTPIKTDFTEAIAYANANGGTLTLLVGADVSSATVTLSKSGLNLWIEGLGANRTISLAGTGRLFSLTGSSTLTLGKNITLKGVSNNEAPLIYIYNSTLVMKAGSVITGNTNTDGSGGGVNVNTGGTFNMEGGEIKNNTANITSSGSRNGGGVTVQANTSTFNMSGGTITGNTAKTNGGGGYVSYGAKFNLNSPAKTSNISGNFAPAGTANQVAKATGETGGIIGGTVGVTEGW